MDQTSREARQRLGELMEARRLELGLSWRKVASRAGIAYETVRAARAGEGGISPLTASRLDKALEWPHGQIERILAGGEPAAAETPARHDSDGHRPLHYDDPRVQKIADAAAGASPLVQFAVAEFARVLLAQEEERQARRNSA